MIGFDSHGSTDKTEAWLQKLMDQQIFDSLAHYGQEGVNALSAATPKDTGLTATSWYYEIKKDKASWSIIWGNTHMDDNSTTPVAILIQTGHGTGTGGYVQGIDFINPALRPIFDRMLADVERLVTQ